MRAGMVTHWIARAACALLLLSAAAAEPLRVRAVAPAQSSFDPPEQITVTMFRLNTSSGTSTGVPCTPGDTAFGCGTPAFPFPYATNPVTISVENDYLLDVVPAELGLSYHPLALEAQVVAARSYAYWNIHNGSRINNSVAFQAFLPGKFESLGVAPDNPVTPCASSNLSANQRAVCAAMKQARYLSPAASELPMFTEFAADWTLRTKTGSRTGLLAVDDPISSGCDADDFGHGRGMSQEGASRWARGNRCSRASRGDEPWSVRWASAEQILVHYYTGAQLRDAETGPLLPELRWNPLRIESLPSVLAQQSRYALGIEVQNTGAVEWTCDTQVISYTLGYRWVLSPGNIIAGAGQGSIGCGLPRGDPSPLITVPITDVPQTLPTTVSLVFDMREHYVNGDIVPFSVSGWAPYTVSVRIIEPLTARLWLPVALR